MSESKSVWIGEVVDSWIREEELAVNVRLSPVKKFDGLVESQRIGDEDGEEVGEDVDEALEEEAYWDFIGWYLRREWVALECVPVQDKPYFWHGNEPDDALSFAFGSNDYLRLMADNDGFDKYYYRFRWVLGRVKDLAIMHSCVCRDESKRSIKERYKRIVEYEFRDEAVALAEAVKGFGVWMDKVRAVERVAELNDRIRRCRAVWRRFAYAD